MTLDAYSGIRFAFKLISDVFFREIKVSGAQNVPTEGPVIFIVAPHVNQFVDPGMAIISNPRRFTALMAQSSFKLKLIGAAARSLNAIPVVRPQDLATKYTNKLIASQDDKYMLRGIDTQFKQELGPRDTIVLSKTLKFEVAEIISDTEIKLKTELSQEALDHLIFSKKADIAYKVIPHVDQSVLYEKVHERLEKNESILIFPEGGSHDRSEMLPLKAGFAIMALGAMAEKEGLDIKIVPIGLNYFHPHRFRSRAVISYGVPICIDSELVKKYKQGGSAKHEAISTLLESGYDGLKSVTVNAPNYDTLMIIATARRLYKPAAEHKLRIDQVVELNRRFLLGYRYFEKDPRLVDLAQRIKAYNNTLKYFGLRDYQVPRTKTTMYSAAPILFSRILKLAFLTIFGFPAIVINSPLLLLTFIISQKKQKEALAGSSVKIAARDVLATWKILVALVGMPTLYGFYSFLLFLYLMHSKQPHAFPLSLLVWVILPFIQYLCVLVIENSVDIYKSLNPLILSLFNPDGAAKLRRMREQLSDTITNFVNENGSTALEDFDKNKFDHLEKHDQIKSRSILNNVDISRLNITKWLDDQHMFFNFGSSLSSLSFDSDTEE